MSKFDFQLKRTYSIYTDEKKSSMVVVSNYHDGILIGQRNISKRELTFIGKLAKKNANQRNILVDQKSLKKLVQFQNHTFDLIWIVPGMKRSLLVVDKDPILINVPDLMFHVSGEKLMVYFVQTNKDGDYEIAKCSYPNVFVDHVCLGNIKIEPPKELLSDEMTKWENYFFNSKFSFDDFKIPEVINYQKMKLK